MKRFHWLIIIAGILVVIIVACVVYDARFANTVRSNSSHTAPGVATACASPVSTNGLQTYTIVPEQTEASYSVNENLIIRNDPNAVAVGTTNSVEGNFQIKTQDAPLVTRMNIKVDLSTLHTNSSMRDRYVQRNTLQTDQYPDATFVSTCAEGLPSSYSDGQTVHFQLTGNLTMHGKTNKTVFDVQGQMSEQTITGTATSTIFMTDFDIDPPNLANVAIAQNEVRIKITFMAKAG